MPQTVEAYEECILVEAALLPPFDPERPNHFGREYNPKKYYECRKERNRADSTCAPFALRRNEPPPVWPYPDAPPIKWPAAPVEAVYRSGMGSEEYFKALCAAEAGKFIYKTVENVEGVYQVRPRYFANDLVLSDKYVMENPYHYHPLEADSIGGGFLGIDKRSGKTRFQFWETSLNEPARRFRPDRRKDYHPSMVRKPGDKDKYIRYESFKSGRLEEITKAYGPNLNSNFGYIWRGISRYRDREYGIAGGELAVIDLRTNEILGLWRGFKRSGSKESRKLWWRAGNTCPQIGPDNTEFSNFIMEVVKPKQDVTTD